MLSKWPSAASDSIVVSKRLATWYSTRSCNPLPAAFCAARRNSPAPALDADKLRSTTCNRQREVAEPAEQVGDALPRLRVEQRQRTSNQHAVDREIDLGKLGRRKKVLDVKIRQTIGKRTRVLRGKSDRPKSVPAAAGRRTTRCWSAKTRSAASSLGRQRLENAQHQRGDRLADRHFDLRQRVGDRQGRDQLAQRHQQQRDVRRQDRALAHVGDEAALALVKADQHAAFLRHPMDRQPRALTISPRCTVNR